MIEKLQDRRIDQMDDEKVIFVDFPKKEEKPKENDKDKDVRKDTPTNRVLNGLNRINEAKLNGVLQKDELAKEEVQVCGLYAGACKLGKEKGDIDSFIALVPNKNVFKYPHEGLEVAASTIKQELSIVEYDLERRTDTKKNPKIRTFRPAPVQDEENNRLRLAS